MITISIYELGQIAGILQVAIVVIYLLIICLIIKLVRDHRYNTYDMEYLPDECAFCDNPPVAILSLRKNLFTTHKYVICDECRHKQIKGELKTYDR